MKNLKDENVWTWIFHKNMHITTNKWERERYQPLMYTKVDSIIILASTNIGLVSRSYFKRCAFDRTSVIKISLSLFLWPILMKRLFIKWKKKTMEILINSMQYKCNIVLDKKLSTKCKGQQIYSKHSKECILKSRAKKNGWHLNRRNQTGTEYFKKQK